MKITEQQDQTRIALEVVSRSNKELFYFLRVDATNGFRINKVKLKHQGRKLLDLDIEYIADDEVGWRIAAWDCASIDGLHISTEVDGCRVNENVPDESFVVEFPAGTEMVPSREFQFLPEKYQKDKKK